MTILNQIVSDKRIQVEKDKNNVSIKQLEGSPFFNRTCYSIKQSILDDSKSGIIAEIKKASPALGQINASVDLEKLSVGYSQAGASAISVLTDYKYFGGKNEDLLLVRNKISCPILRKDFIIDEYQIIEAKSIGADCILLIGAILTESEIVKFSKLSKALGLSIIYEVHDESELGKLNNDIDIVGVNNRNLSTMKIDISNSYNLVNKIPNQFIKISESGLSKPNELVELRKVGYQGFLIGSNFMKFSNPEEECKKFIKEYKLLLADNNGN